MKVQKDVAAAFSNLKVLVVDDNNMNLKLATFMFSGLSIPAETCRSGAEAIERLQKGDVSIVLLDIEMPGMDGYECASKIRNELGLTIPLVAMTAHQGEEELKKALESGMDDHLSKPLTEENVGRILSKYFAQAGNNS